MEPPLNIAALAAVNARRWANAKLTRAPEFTPVAQRLVAFKGRYMAVSARTGVPWFFIAVAHQRESSGRFDRQLGQGDPINQVSTHDPKGRGPFATFEDSAVDALVKCPPFAARNADWSVGGTLAMLEQYNGLGYAAKGLASPYIWSGTNQYVKGKYVADHVFDPEKVDVQLGCAGLLMAMQVIDPTIQFHAVTVNAPVAASGQTVVPPHPASVPSITNPAKGSIGAFIASALSSIFKH